MIPLPLTCKLLRNYSDSRTVAVNTFGDVIQDTVSLAPNPIGTVRDFVWVNLSYFEVQQVEYWLAKSKGSKRFSYAGESWVLTGGYSVEVAANKPQITANMRKVA